MHLISVSHISSHHSRPKKEFDILYGQVLGVGGDVEDLPKEQRDEIQSSVLDSQDAGLKAMKKEVDKNFASVQQNVSETQRGIKSVGDAELPGLTQANDAATKKLDKAGYLMGKRTKEWLDSWKGNNTKALQKLAEELKKSEEGMATTKENHRG